MKKFFMAVLIAMLALVNIPASAQVQIDYGESKIYSQEDMDEAIALIQEQFAKWKECEMHNLRYAGDECNSEENIKWMNELIEARGYKDKCVYCIEFFSDFYVSKDARKYNSTFNPDYEYKDWQWWLARTDKGEWELLTWGY